MWREESLPGSEFSLPRNSRSKRLAKATSSGVSSTTTKSMSVPSSGRDRPNGSSTTMIGVEIVTSFVTGWRIGLPRRSSNRSSISFGTFQAAGSAPSAVQRRESGSALGGHSVVVKRNNECVAALASHSSRQGCFACSGRSRNANDITHLAFLLSDPNQTSRNGDTFIAPVDVVRLTAWATTSAGSTGRLGLP
jgi:hypothetical protein